MWVVVLGLCGWWWGLSVAKIELKRETQGKKECEGREIILK